MQKASPWKAFDTINKSKRTLQKIFLKAEEEGKISCMEKMTCFPRLFSSIVHEHSPKSHYLHKQIGYWIGETNIRFSSASDEFKIRIAIHTIRRNAINFNNILWAPFFIKHNYGCAGDHRAMCRLHHCTLKSDRNNNNRKMKIRIRR